VALVVSAALAALGKWWGGVFENFEWVLHILNFVVSLAVTTVLFALMYKILPRVKIGWRDVWIGSAATALLFTIGKFLVGLYIGKSSVVSSFGAAGSLAVLLVWVYYSAQIFLLGAEFTWVYAHRYGSRQGKDRPATAKETAATTRQPEGQTGLPRLQDG
jgi:membrane protein